MRISNWNFENRRCLFCWPLALLVLLASAPLGQAQGKCAEQMAQAEKEYTNGNFDATINLLTACLDAGQLTQPEKQRAYKLLGLAYIGKDYVDQAKTAVWKLLELVPKYEPDPAQDPPGFTNLVQEMKKEIATKKEEKKLEAGKKSKSKKWLWIGGGVAVGVGAAVALSGGGGEAVTPPTSRLLPGPPAIP